MRHQKKFNHLGRTKSHREAMLSNMATSLIMHKRINTTVAKAKALRKFVEPLITRSKDDSTHSRRIVFRDLQSKDAVTELFREVAPKVSDRPGGYTRIIKTGNRQGDNAEMAMIELVDYNDLYVTDKKESSAKKSTRRSRRGGGSGAAKPAAAAPAAEATEEAPAAAAEVATEEAPAVEEAPVAEAEAPAAEAAADAPSDDATPEAPADEEEKKEGE